MGDKTSQGPQSPSGRRPLGDVQTPGPEASFPRWQLPAAVGALVLAGVLAYCNSFQGPFIYDDQASIVTNPNIRRLWPIWQAMSGPPQETVAGRPILSLSLAVNYRISGLKVWSYHACNLAIHILAGLTLFGIIRRTLLSRRLKDRFGRASWVLALICALIWLVHPLNTQAVTYVIQRAESLMGLFYLLTVYCAIRGLDSSPKGLWQAAAVVCCAAGMGTKEVMVTAPLMVVLYDRVFAFGSFKQAVARRWRLYLALAATSAILAALVTTGSRSQSAGFGLQVMTPLDYAKTQCKVIIRYLRLTFWPSGLVFDYAWPPARSFAQFAPWAAALLGILGWTIHSLRRWPELGFCCVSFFLILAPTSSLVPIGDVIFEHRMYLPLAAVVAAVALCVYLHGKRLLNRMATSDGSRAVVASILGYGLSGVIVASLAVLTVIRNGDYSSEIAIWRDTVNKRDRSQRAHSSLGIAYAKGGHYDLALLHYDRAIELDPKYASPHVGRGVIHGRRGDHDKAIQEFTKAIELDPNSSAAYKNRGAAYLYRHDYPKALADVDTAIQLDPYNASAHEARNEILAQMQSAR